MKSENITNQSINQEKLDKIVYDKNLYLEHFAQFKDGKFSKIPNPNFDPAYKAAYDEQQRIANINLRNAMAQKELECNGNKGSRIFTEAPVIRANSTQDYAEQSSKINEIYRRLTWIKDPVRRMEKAKFYYAQNKNEVIPSKQKRINGLRKQRAKAISTPAFIDLSISQEQVGRIIEDLRKLTGKNKLEFNCSFAVLNELVDVARKGRGYIYMTQKTLGKRLGFARETINRAIDNLKKLGILITHKLPWCPNIIQLTKHLISSQILQLLAAFSYGRSYFQLRDITYRYNNYDNNIIVNNKNVEISTQKVEERIQKEENIQINGKGLNFLQDLFKKLNISTPVLCPDTTCPDKNF